MLCVVPWCMSCHHGAMLHAAAIVTFCQGAVLLWCHDTMVSTSKLLWSHGAMVPC